MCISYSTKFGFISYTTLDLTNRYSLCCCRHCHVTDDNTADCNKIVTIRKLKTWIGICCKITWLILWHVRSRQSGQNKSQMIWTLFPSSPKVEKFVVFLSVVIKPLFYVQVFIVAIPLWNGWHYRLAYVYCVPCETLGKC